MLKTQFKTNRPLNQKEEEVDAEQLEADGEQEEEDSTDESEGEEDSEEDSEEQPIQSLKLKVNGEEIEKPLGRSHCTCTARL